MSFARLLALAVLAVTTCAAVSPFCDVRARTLPKAALLVVPSTKNEQHDRNRAAVVSCEKQAVGGTLGEGVVSALALPRGGGVSGEVA